VGGWGIFCDLQKAFDCVKYKILFDKLEFYGIDGKFKTLIRSYLTGRYQRVVLAIELIVTTHPNGTQLNVVFSGLDSWSLVFFYFTLMTCLK
jgi:hypothetical protein